MKKFIVLTAFAGLLAGCLAPKAEQDHARQIINQMGDETLAQLYQVYPETRSKVRAGAGYAVFNNTNANLLLIGGGTGYGLCFDNINGFRTYMKMAQLGLGPGLGAKDYRLIFIFNSREVLENFVTMGWEFGGQVDAAAKSPDKGGALGAQVSFQREVEVYTLTQAGVSLQAMISGTRFWRNSDLN